jgi:hypothetical protein
MTPWSIPRMWEGGECWIIGGGPSMPRQFGVPENVISAVLKGERPLSSYSPFLSPIHDKHVIGVNAAFMLGSWIDVTFFGDSGFYFSNKVELDALNKLKVCCNPNVNKRENDIFDVKYVPHDLRHSKGISERKSMVSWNLNSGGAAINLAYHLGVSRVYLLGFDMKVGEDGRQHWHSHYLANKNPDQPPKDAKKLPFKRHGPCFTMIANDARRLGLEIINVSPESELTVFKRVKLSDGL